MMSKIVLCALKNQVWVDAGEFYVESSGEIHGPTLSADDLAAGAFKLRLGDSVHEVKIQNAVISRLEGVQSAVEAVLCCNVPATFRPQTWIDDNVVDIDDGLVEFNAIRELAKLGLITVSQMFANGRDFDCLANQLPEFKAHNGPFEVDIDEGDALLMVALMAGMPEVPPSFSEVSTQNWANFQSAVQTVYSIQYDSEEFEDDLAEAEGVA